MNKTLLILIILAVVIAAVWMVTREQAQAPAERSDTTGAIEQDIQNLDLGDLEREFQEIDSQINQL